MVLSSADEESWRFETAYQLGTDLREPRLLSLGETLFLYVSKLGDDPLAFEPQGMFFAERAPDGTWSELERSVLAPTWDGACARSATCR